MRVLFKLRLLLLYFRLSLLIFVYNIEIFNVSIKDSDTKHIASINIINITPKSLIIRIVLRESNIIGRSNSFEQSVNNPMFH